MQFQHLSHNNNLNIPLGFYNTIRFDNNLYIKITDYRFNYTFKMGIKRVWHNLLARPKLTCRARVPLHSRLPAHISSKGKIPRGEGVRKPVIRFLSAEFKGLLDL